MKGVKKILPNVDTHPEFAKALWKAKEKGVRLIARDCIVTEDEIRIDREIRSAPVRDGRGNGTRRTGKMLRDRSFPGTGKKSGTFRGARRRRRIMYGYRRSCCNRQESRR